MAFKHYSGLTTEEIKQKIANNQVNRSNKKATKTTSQILKENTLTIFNFLNFLLAVVLIAVHAFSNLFFIAIIILNILIGIVQEIRARNMVEKLTLLSKNKVRVIRNNQTIEIDAEEIVLDDILILKAGEQIPSDALVLEGTAEANESLLTGESDTIPKNPDSHLLSGSYLTSGEVIARVERVGDENYATKLVSEAKQAKPIISELVASIAKISKFTSYIILPIGVILFAESFFLHSTSTKAAVIASVAALLGMLPKGLVLLISIALSTSVIRLSKKQVLVQNMYAVEMLARMDTLCLDKTGTLTQGNMQVETVERLGTRSHEEITEIIGSYLAATSDNNLTMQALRDYFTDNAKYTATSMQPFSSERKWGSVTFEQIGTFYLGSPENLMPGFTNPAITRSQEQGLRVLLFTHSTATFNEQQALALVVLSDPLRTNVQETLRFFTEQGVDLKVISGDNPKTVAAIAEKAGIPQAANFIDMSQVTEDADIRSAATTYTVFGRVTPYQKRLIVDTLQDEKVVGMTGDGVNDILALREADISITMAEGDSATKQISDVVLLESDFAVLPEIIYEGRRVINNVTRSSSVFFIKTIYSLLLSIVCIVTGTAFPFIPIQITLIDLAIEGYPSFFLSFESNRQPAVKNFLKTALTSALPSAVTFTVNVLIVYLLTQFSIIDTSRSASLMYFLLIGISCVSVIKTCLPLNPLRAFLAVTTTVGTFVAIYLFHSFLEVTLFNMEMFLPFILLMILNILALSLVWMKKRPTIS